MAHIPVVRRNEAVPLSSLLRQGVFVMQAPEHRPFHNAEARWQPVSVPSLRNALLGGFRKAGTERGVRPASVVMLGPESHDRPQVMLVKWNKEIQALAAQTSAEPLTNRVRLRRPDRRA